MDSFLEHAEQLLSKNKNVILAGDFNVIMSDKDVYNPELFKGNALFRKEVIQRLNKLSFIGYCDTFRNLYPNESGYTFWDYTGGALQNDFGMRIDYIFSSPALTDKLQSCFIDKDFRNLPKSSDHTILIANFED
jgi:exodeoxyribonuclease-3